MSIAALIEAVEAGKEYIDRRVQDAFGGYRHSHISQLVYKAYNGSLDAAMSLHEALLPGWGWMIGDKGSACVIAPDHLYEKGVRGNASKSGLDPARSWLLAILRAKEAGQ